jgi:hypothetical protein
MRFFYEDDESDDTVVQPDLTVICGEKKRGPEGCRGAPELAVEILSPSNTAIEMDRKFSLYLTAGIQEYRTRRRRKKPSMFTASGTVRRAPGSTGTAAGLCRTYCRVLKSPWGRFSRSKRPQQFRI